MRWPYTIFHAYSDASIGKDGKSAIAYVVTEECGKIFVKGSGIVELPCVKTEIAELIGHLAALKSIPDNRVVIMHTDMNSIKSIMTSKKRRVKFAVRHEVVRQIKQELERVICHFRFEKPKKRSKFYRYCHKKARFVLYELETLYNGVL